MFTDEEIHSERITNFSVTMETVGDGGKFETRPGTQKPGPLLKALLPSMGAALHLDYSESCFGLLLFTGEITSQTLGLLPLPPQPQAGAEPLLLRSTYETP